MRTGSRVTPRSQSSADSASRSRRDDSSRGAGPRLAPTYGTVVLPDGTEVVVRGYLHLWGWDRDFERVAGPLRAAGVQHDGRVGDGTAVLVEARGYVDVLVPLLRADPTYLFAEHERARA